MLIPVPPEVPDTLAVLADPFAVSMHAIVHHPPPPGGKALVYGAGALGVTSVAALRALYPDVEVAVVARFAAQADARHPARAPPRCGPHEPARQVVEALADWSGGVLHAPFDGLPVAKPGGSTSSTTRSPTRDPRSRGETAPGTGHPRSERGVHPGPLRVDAHLLQRADAGRLQRVRRRGGRGRAQARHRALPRPRRVGARGPERHAHSPVPTRAVVGRIADPRPPGHERSDQGRLRAVRGGR